MNFHLVFGRNLIDYVGFNGVQIFLYFIGYRDVRFFDTHAVSPPISCYEIIIVPEVLCSVCLSNLVYRLHLIVNLIKKTYFLSNTMKKIIFL